ncbi:hypothetical protein CCMSSC00406_0008574 [Pleurotus cornucopiae]|uniref:Uncharacterized protein n=1 Tax=Pleurotus cornucopiae TaxID=5321 RepID=A0ACB7IK85_PLECO|nr:hypothetical protein CCMSSC00406_0008574 [Pleurotus cornucopiae]
MPSLSRRMITGFLVALLFASAVLATDVTKGPSKRCREVIVRKEWRTLSAQNKARYIGAVKCLQALPAQTSFTGVRTRFDDFQALHVSLMPEIHLVGQFLPWHRRMLQVYEKALREECGYTGAQPYWDWTRDVDGASIVAASPVFDPVFGFGGNGIDIPGYAGQFGNMSDIPGWTGGGCITDGPFASYNLSIGPGTLVTNHCLTRSFNTFAVAFIRSSQVANTTKQPNFERFRIELEGTPVTPTLKVHDAGHLSVGGEMNDRWSSPGDPVFYLHHSNLDRIWWEWQSMDLKRRLTDISGRTSIDPPVVNVTLDFKLKMGILADLIPIRDVMDVRASPMCYIYA